MSSNITIGLVGDVYLGEGTPLRLDASVSRLLATFDLVIANQEGPICAGGKPVSGKCVLRSAPKAAQVLRDWGVDVVTLANNHMFDMGLSGFDETRRRLDAVGIHHLGAGGNVQEASAPLTLDVKGLSIGLLAYSWERIETTCATRAQFGCAPLNHDMMLEATRRLAREVDFVIVLPHWGYCDYEYPPPEHLILGRQLLGAGETAVVGHHSHVVQGVVADQRGVLACSLGNFAMAHFTSLGRGIDFSAENFRGMVAVLQLARGHPAACDTAFTRQQDDRITVDNSPRRRQILRKRSRLLKASNYESHWRRYVHARLLRRLVYWSNILNWRKLRRQTLMGGRVMFRSMLGKAGATDRRQKPDSTGPKGTGGHGGHTDHAS